MTSARRFDAGRSIEKRGPRSRNASDDRTAELENDHRPASVGKRPRLNCDPPPLPLVRTESTTLVRTESTQHPRYVSRSTNWFRRPPTSIQNGIPVVSSSTAVLLALVGAAALVPVCKFVAFRVGCVATPRSDRWHQRPTPLLGGLAIVIPVLVGVIVSGDVREHGTLVACAGLVALVGLIDDVLTISPATKLVAQIAFASLFVFMGYRLHWVESMTLDSLLTLFWVVGITNAFNLLDNMDGLCAGVALIAGTAFLVSSVTQPAGEAVDGLYLPLLVGAVAGFLFYN